MFHGTPLWYEYSFYFIYILTFACGLAAQGSGFTNFSILIWKGHQFIFVLWCLLIAVIYIHIFCLYKCNIFQLFPFSFASQAKGIFHQGSHLSLRHVAVFQPLPLRLFLLSAVSSASLSPSASRDILSTRECQTLTENFDVLCSFWWESMAPAAHFVPTCVTLACFFDLKIYVRPDELSRQPQHTHQSCDVERAAKYCPPVPIIWAIALKLIKQTISRKWLWLCYVYGHL